MKKNILSIIILTGILFPANNLKAAAEWQWSTPVTEWISDETNAHPQAFLWIPEDWTKIPPRAKFPVKVTVVAWQYGIAGKIQTAEAVEQSFYVLK
jgi:hypothetical protein